MSTLEVYERTPEWMVKKSKFVIEFPDIPAKRQPMRHLSLEERRLNFEEVELGFTEEAAMAEARRCLSCRRCIGCGLCLAECDRKAIEYSQQAERIKLEVGAIILAPGFDEFDANRKKELGYGKCANVVSSIEFERILSPTGPFEGMVLRPSDGTVPKKIAFVLCVGSREEAIGANYCSNVCCMSTLKEAIIAKKRIDGLEAVIFHKDLRPRDIDSEAYLAKAQADYKIEFVKIDAIKAVEKAENSNVVLEYFDGGEGKSREFELVVLAVGLRAPRAARELSDKIGIRLNKYNFSATSKFSPLETSKKGIYTAGAFNGPKELSRCLAEASAAAAKVAGTLSSATNEISTCSALPLGSSEKRSKSGRVGLFLCQTGMRHEDKTEPNGASAAIEGIGGVSCIKESPFWCRKPDKELLQRVVREEELDKVIIAPCHAETHREIFEETAAAVGLDATCVEIIDIRHWKGECGCERAKAMSGEASKMKPLEKDEEASVGPLVGAGLILGGGISGIIAALDTAAQGFQVTIVERQGELGGRLRKVKYLMDGESPKEALAALVSQVENNDRIRVLKNSTIKLIRGSAGHYITTVHNSEGEQVIEHGCLIFANGAADYIPGEYLYGKEEKVLRQSEFEAMLAGEEFKGKSAVMIQCVGSRRADRPYCGQVCCAEAIKNALMAKKNGPESQVYILHKGIRVYGFDEDYYTEAIEQGIQFIQVEDDPSVAALDGLRVRAVEVRTGREIDLSPDLLVLSTPFISQPENKEFARMVDVPLNDWGFFDERLMLAQPGEGEKNGIFSCGLTRSPQSISECIVQASAVALKACSFMRKAQGVALTRGEEHSR